MSKEDQAEGEEHERFRDRVQHFNPGFPPTHNDLYKKTTKTLTNTDISVFFSCYNHRYVLC